MSTMVSVCGVMCSGCPAYQGASKGKEHQCRTAEAWHKIYDLNEPPERISCGGCLGSDGELFHTQVQCRARQCCLGKGLRSCAECSVEDCPDLEKAQSVWDGVPDLRSELSASDFETYAQPYCGHRVRLRELRARRRTGGECGR
jgi:hypothetical protein